MFKLKSILKSIDKINDQKNLKQDFTLKNLESQMNASIGLNSSKEYKFWLLTYARYLSDNRKFSLETITTAVTIHVQQIVF